MLQHLNIPGQAKYSMWAGSGPPSNSIWLAVAPLKENNLWTTNAPLKAGNSLPSVQLLETQTPSPAQPNPPSTPRQGALETGSFCGHPMAACSGDSPPSQS